MEVLVRLFVPSAENNDMLILKEGPVSRKQALLVYGNL